MNLRRFLAGAALAATSLAAGALALDRIFPPDLQRYHEVALLDLLPAGFEIESVLNEDTVKSFPFLAKLSETRIAEARDDRFFASFNLGRRTYRSWWDDAADSVTNSFHVAYIVRAVTPGSFTLPAVNASDMYAPRVYARSGMGRVVIAPR